MVSTFLIIIGISTIIIAVAGIIGLLIKLIQDFRTYESGWAKTREVLNMLVVVALGSGISTLFFVVSQLVY